MAAKRAQNPTLSLEGFSRYSGYFSCLKIIWRELGRAEAHEGDLPPYQYELLRDLESGLDEGALADLHNYWEYDLDALMLRGREWDKSKPAKPRIDLDVAMSSNGNLKVEWFPRGMGTWWADRTQVDFPNWFRLEHRRGGWDSRPSNEILFIHSAGHALEVLHLDHPHNRFHLLNHVLLQACARLVRQIEVRLEPHFDVRMKSEVFVKYAAAEDLGDDRSDWREPPDKIISWEIDDPERRQNEEELAELKDIEQRLGFSEKHFLELWEQASRRKPTGPPAAPENVSTKVAKAFRGEGIQVTKTQTDRARYLVEKHRKPKPKAEGLRIVK